MGINGACESTSMSVDCGDQSLSHVSLRFVHGSEAAVRSTEMGIEDIVDSGIANAEKPGIIHHMESDIPRKLNVTGNRPQESLGAPLEIRLLYEGIDWVGTIHHERGHRTQRRGWHRTRAAAENHQEIDG